MSVTFDQPLVLGLLVPTVVLVYVLWRTSHVYLPPLRRYAALGLRLTAVSLLVFALAGPNVRLNASDLAVAVLLDRSDSVTPAQRAQEEAWVADALAHKNAADKLAVIGFAGQAAVERPLSADSTSPVMAEDSTLQGSSTDIGGAIRLGLGILPPDAARRIVLISDGNENTGQAQQAAALAHAAGVQIDTVALTGDSGPKALVESLDAPARLHEGDRFSVTAQIRATQPMPATLQLLADDRLIASQDVQLQTGANRFIMPADTLQAGTHVLRLVMQTDADPRPENKTGGAYVIVDGPPSVLVVEGAPGDGQYVAEALRAAGLRVDVAHAQDGPFQPDTLNNYASVVMANVPASQIAADSMDALKNYVQTHGGGLVVSGGDKAYGPGLYARTPLEDMLPVQTDLRGTTLQTGVGLVLVIDTSGSMGQNVGGTTIMDLAKAAALAAADSLGPNDQIGVISFEEKSTWAIQPTPASQMNAISSAVNQMTPGGGDDTLGGVLNLAYGGLSNVTAKSKHVIVITDGETPGGDYAGIIQTMQANGVSVSTIGIGSQADTQLLQQLAQMGGGAYYDGSDPFNLPQLLVKETQQLQRAAIVEKDTQPVLVNSSPMLDGIDPQSLPALRGYVATTPKPQSTVVLASPSSDPLLTEWQYGLGRVISWASDASNRWSSPWLNSGQLFEPFWAQVVKRTIRAPEDPNRQVGVHVSGSMATVTLDAQSGMEGSPQRQYVNFLPVSAAVIGPQGVAQQVPMPQVAPGRYQASLPVASDGVYRLQVTENESDGTQASQSSGFVVPYSPEYRDLATNDVLLGSLAASTDGHPIQSADQAFAHDLPAVGAPRPIWPALMALLALVLVADVAVRRLRLSSFGARAGYLEVRKRLGYIDERPPSMVRPAPPQIHAVPLVSAGARAHTARSAPIPTAAPRSQQLLAAKRRAAKR
jgi:Mg-chelatase subunit ChlD/uncharacterized membrane protein